MELCRGNDLLAEINKRREKYYALKRVTKDKVFRDILKQKQEYRDKHPIEELVWSEKETAHLI